MATWQEVKQFMYRNYNIHSDEDGVLSLVFEAEGGRTQLVLLTQFNNYLRIFSPVALEGQVPPGAVLNGAGLFGAGVLGGHYGLVHVQLLDTIDDAELLEVLPLIAGFADDLESSLTTGDAF